MIQKIPFVKPFIGHEELEAIEKVLKSGVLRGDGNTGREVQKIISDLTGSRHVFFTTSCTHALEMAMLAIDIKEGDEVIMPSFTFVSSANAVVALGGKPVFADIQPGTLNLDPNDIESRITNRTKAIIPVHYAGVGCEMDEITALAKKYHLTVVEDAAQGLGAYYKGKHLGSIGDIGCFSFHDTKNITCGEGGAFITNSAELAHKAEIIREKGTNRSAFLRGEVDKYTWVGRGSSYVQSEILAGVLLAQILKKDKIHHLRESAWYAYFEFLKIFSDSGFIQLPLIDENCKSNYHSFFFTVNEIRHRDLLLNKLKESGISASFHYVPLHSSPFGRNVLGNQEYLPVTDSLSDSLIRLPLYPDIKTDHPDFADRVFEVISHFFGNRS